MAIAIAGIGIALNRRIARYRHRPGIAFGAISGESNADRRLGSAQHGVRDSDIRTLVLSRSKIGMHSDARPDEIDDGIRVRDRQARRKYLCSRGYRCRRDETR